ncbi:MAG: hypothetical protein M0P04_09215 [Syntrophales bacterium]|nr:hypothetical protein [Syntrophales bacterium]MDD4339801.1 hypothetical protein [Syntrophales bacterium]HOG08828.1 hypothetical protein [Syntrophales bacterium]HPB70220.1 hypothetical protein [Syntrophales bacterium]HQN25729.1 hypothetical protein [Syntrophales bacterium]
MAQAFQTRDADTGGDAGDFVRTFLFGSAGVRREGRTLRSVIVMDEKKQGWVGIPHGGIAMGAVADLAGDLTEECPGPFGPYPYAIDYRMGGASARLGDTLAIEVTATASGARGSIVKDPRTPPYLSASVRFGGDAPSTERRVPAGLPARIDAWAGRLLDLPFYRNCFVCGIARRQTGLGRRFYVPDVPDSPATVVSPIGCLGDDGAAFWRFQRQGRLHPLPLVALLDEIIGWGGFLLTASGGVTVRASYTFYRDIAAGEPLLVFGRGEKVRGNARSRLLFWASGGAAAVRSDGGLEPVAAASGQYLGIGALTEQMKRELLPADLTRRAFQLAGADV